jgi:TPR repeat protein
MWSGRDMKIYGWAFSGNTLYLVGTLWDNGRSIVRSIDIKTQEANDKVGNSGVIPSDIAFGEKGLTITQYASNGQSSDFVFPYAARDRQFQIEQVLKNYDLKKASDQIALGERYLNGNVVDKDEKRAVELFEKAANQNSDIGMLKLAECYKKGVGVTKDNAKAFSLYDKSANMGNSDAMIALSDMYAEGNGIEKNMSKALYWKEKLAFKGNLNAQKYVLANQSVNYEKYDISADNALTVARESHKDGNYDWAKFCYERAISLGSKDAMFDYGKWLYEGNGITKDYNKAVEYLTQLGEENNVNAQMLLKKIYKENKGIAPDVKKEMYWAVKAAENGDVDSQLSLGYAYKNGIGVKKDKKLAFAMYEKAAEQGNQDAIKEVFYLYITGNGVKKNADNAYLWFDKLDADNQIEVANSFVEGIKVKSNKETGFWLYVRAAKNDDPNALKKVALCYFYGIGVKSDLLTAYNIANKIKTITSKEDDGDLYYIEGKYYESTHRSTALIKQCYERAVAYGNKDAIEALSSFYKKYGY